MFLHWNVWLDVTVAIRAFVDTEIYTQNDSYNNMFVRSVRIKVCTFQLATLKNTYFNAFDRKLPDYDTSCSYS